MHTSKPLIALLGHFPECDLAKWNFEFDAESAADLIAIGAFSTVEGAFLRAFAKYLPFQFHFFSFSKFVASTQRRRISENLQVTVIPPVPFSGMVSGWKLRSKLIRKLVCEHECDAVVGFRNIEGYGRMAIESGLPATVVIEETVHGIPCPFRFALSFGVARRVERRVVRRARHMVVISEHLRKRMLAFGARCQIENIPNIVGDRFFEIERNNPSYLLYVGRIAEEKGLLDLLEALRILSDRGERPQLKVVGGAMGTESVAHLQKCEIFCSRYLAKDQVEFLGSLRSDEVAALHASCLALVMPSFAKYEGMGLVIAEAMAAGTPVIAYNFGPIPEFVTDQQDGLLVEARCTDHLATAIERVATDENWLQSASRHARQRGHRYLGSAVASAYGEVINGLLKNRK